MLFIWLLFVVSLSFSDLADPCPKFITCVTSETEKSCPQGTFYREKTKVHGCCPGCVPLKEETQTCASPQECQPGLTCSIARKCERDPLQACEYYKRFDLIWTKYKYWTPVCLADGTYAPKQCKGEKQSGKCFCVDRKGNRIFGEEEWSKADNMTCACSRLADEMEQKGSTFTLHCDSLGNFEPLQCDQKVCWCASPQSGIPYAAMVPAEAMTSLPCYNKQKAGVQYYRQCDSTKHMQENAKSLLFNHGTKTVTLVRQNCSFDGSFHRIQNVKAKKRCVYLNNIPLTEAISSDDANCNCAYDGHVALLRHDEFLFDCMPNGNYMTKQIWNGAVHCIDKDGFPYSSDPRDC